jgi:bifunctional non-homologous end joining protein LigD
VTSRAPLLQLERSALFNISPGATQTFHHPLRARSQTRPPTGPDWLHEVKHDGWRAQQHLSDGAVTIYTKRGTDLTERFREVAEAVAKVPAHSLIIDAELTACDCRNSVS